MPNKITTFQDEYRFLSNFYPVIFIYDGLYWPSAEHAYQAAKFPDITSKLHIQTLSTPAQAKKAGSKGKISQDWNQRKAQVMLEICRAKFQTPSLRDRLIATDDAILEEGNYWRDTYWGICPPNSGIGRNELGKILMTLRTEFQAN